MGGIHRKTHAPGRAGSLQGACCDLGCWGWEQEAIYLFIAFFLPTNPKIKHLKQAAGADQGQRRLSAPPRGLSSRGKQRVWRQSSLAGLAFYLLLPSAQDTKVTAPAASLSAHPAARCPLG